MLAEHLTRAAHALASLDASFEAAPPGAAPFAEVLRTDARRAHAALTLVLAQPGISSQLVDSLNASIHLRALLADLFLLSELRSAQAQHVHP